jgi:outer membrane protein
MKRALLHVIFFSAAISGFAQTSWTLEQCINYALKNNLSIKQSELNVQSNKNNSTQAKAALLPTLNGGAAHTYNFGKTIDRYTNSFATQMVLSQNFYLTSSVTLWSGLSQYNTIKQNELNYQSSVENVNQQKNDLSLNVATSFLQVVYSDQLKAVQKNQVEISNEQLERTKKLADAGTIAKSNVYDVEAQLAADQYNLVAAENNYKIALLTLQQLMNLDTVSNFKIETPNLEPGEMGVENLNVIDIYNAALKTQPLIRSAEFAWKSAERGLYSAKGMRSPTLSLSASIGTGYSGLNYNYSYNPISVASGYTSSYDTVFLIEYNPIKNGVKPFNEQFKGNLNKSISLQLNVPLFNGLRTHTSIENNKLNVFNQKLSYDISRQQLMKNIANAHVSAVAAYEKYKSAKSALAAAETAFTYTETKFNAGTISAFDFSTAKNRVLKAQADLLNAKFDFVFRLKVLDFYQGKPLTL